MYLNNKGCVDCKIVYILLIIEHNGDVSPEKKKPILTAFIKQKAAEKNPHQHSHYRLCYFLSFFFSYRD